MCFKDSICLGRVEREAELTVNMVSMLRSASIGYFVSQRVFGLILVILHSLSVLHSS